MLDKLIIIGIFTSLLILTFYALGFYKMTKWVKIPYIILVVSSMSFSVYTEVIQKESPQYKEQLAQDNLNEKKLCEQPIKRTLIGQDNDCKIYQASTNELLYVPDSIVYKTKERLTCGHKTIYLGLCGSKKDTTSWQIVKRNGKQFYNETIEVSIEEKTTSENH